MPLIGIAGLAVYDAAKREQRVVAPIAHVPKDFAFGQVHLLNITRFNRTK